MGKAPLIVLIAGLAAVLSLGGDALAQSKSSDPVPPAAACPPGTTGAPPTVGGPPAPDLSDRLAQSKGVICPPAGVDPEMQKQPPAEGEIRVIPAPGTPGGDPNVQPK